MYIWRLVVIVLVVAILGACSTTKPNQSVLEPEANYWQQMGSVAGTGSNVSLAQTATGIPVIASSTYDDVETNIVVRTWNGSSWVNIGSPLSNDANIGAIEPSLALDNSGNPVVAWSESDPQITINVHVARWNGNSWVSLSGLNFYLGIETNALDPSLAIDASGNPVVAHAENDDGSVSDIIVSRWSGSSWTSFGLLSGSTAANSYAFKPSLALDSAGNPVVAWQESDGPSNIYVQRFNGTSWVNVGSGVLSGSSVTGSNAESPSLALDSSGNPVVAWREFDGAVNKIYVQKFNGSSWGNVGTGVLTVIGATGDSSESSYYPLNRRLSLALDGLGNPVVAWRDYTGSSPNIYLQQFNGSSWVNLGAATLDTNLANSAFSPSVSFINGSLSVAWQEGLSFDSDSLYVKKYITNSWQDMGGLLDVAGGQSALNSSIARKTNNNPVVAWDEDDSVSGTRNVYVKEWTGTAWSSLAGAVDRINGDAENPSIAMRSDNRPVVAWQENNNVYVRRWTGTLWSSVGIALDTVLANDAITPSLALQLAPSLDIPMVAYAENGDILVKKANGTLGSSIWAALGAALDTTIANEAYRPSLALKADNNPIVAWYEDIGTSFNIYAKEWNGTAWTPLGTTIDKTVSRDAKDIVLAIRTDNRPVVAWEEAGNVYVKRWTGTSWVSLGGVLDEVSSNEALRPAIDLRTDNNPVVSWQEWNGSSYDVLVKRWTGTTWAFIAGEIDKNPSRSARRPSLVLKSNNAPILSWDEWDGVSENIYVRQF